MNVTRLLAACLLPSLVGACSHGIVATPTASLSPSGPSLAALQGVPLTEDAPEGPGSLADDADDVPAPRKVRRAAPAARTRTGGVDPSAVLRYAEVDRARWRAESRSAYLDAAKARDPGPKEAAAREGGPTAPAFRAADMTMPPPVAPLAPYVAEAADTATDAASSAAQQPGVRSPPPVAMSTLQPGSRSPDWSDPPGRLSSR